METTVDTSIPYLTSLSYLQTQSLNKENAKSQASLSKSIEHISTGLRVIDAGDDLAGFAIADRLDVQAQGMTKALQNTNEALTAARVAESSLNEYTDILGYMKELAEKATNKNLSLDDRQILQKEIDNLQDRLKNIASETTFRGRKLLNGTYRTQNIQVGGSVGEVMSVSLKTARPDQIGLHEVVSGGEMNDSGGKSSGDYAAILNGVETGDSFTIQGHSGAQYIEVMAESSAKEIADAVNDKSDLTGITAKATTYLKVYDMKNVAGAPAPTIDVSLTIHGASDTSVNATLSAMGDQSAYYNLEQLYEELSSKYASTHVKPELSADQSAITLKAEEGYDIGIEDFTTTAAGFTILNCSGLESDGETVRGQRFLNNVFVDSFRISGYVELQSEEPFIVFAGSNPALFSSTGSTHLPALKALDAIDITSQDSAEEALEIIERANTYVDNIHADVQSYESGFEAIMQRLESAADQMEDSKHKIIDADLVEETMTSSRATIQIQSQNSLLTQANRLIPEYSLFLIRQ